MSPCSEGNTVHGVTIHDDGTIVERHLVTNALRDQRYQPIYMRSVINPHSLPALELPARGQVVRLPIYDPAAYTMHYALWLASPEAGRAFKFDAPYSLGRYEFRAFTVLLPFCYTPVPSPEVGRIIEYATTSRDKRTAQHATLGNRVGPSEGASGPATVGYIVRDFNRVIATPLGAVGLVADPPPLTPQVANFFALPLG